jgi:hypothetical protein
VKKLLVLLMVVVAMMFVVNVAMAEVKAPTTVDGKVEVVWTSGSSDGLAYNGFGQTLDGKLNFEVSKDFGEGVTGGFNVRLCPVADASYKVIVKEKYAVGSQPTGAVRYDPAELPDADGKVSWLVEKDITADGTDSVKYDGAGWVKMDLKPVVIQAKTSIDGNVGKDITAGVDSKPGFQLDYTVIEGTTATLLLNGNNDAVGAIGKVKYDKGGIYVGGGYQFNGAADALNTGFGAIAGYSKDAISASAEFFSIEAGMGYQVTAGYKVGTLVEINAGAYGKSPAAGCTISKGDPDKYSAKATTMNTGTAEGIVGFGDVKVNITETINVKGIVEYTTAAFDAALSYKGEASATFNKLVLSGYAKAYPGHVDAAVEVPMEVEGKLTYKVAAGVDCWTEVVYNTVAVGKVGVTATF